jgi:hypothetical protein
VPCTCHFLHGSEHRGHPASCGSWACPRTLDLQAMTNARTMHALDSACRLRTRWWGPGVVVDVSCSAGEAQLHVRMLSLATPACRFWTCCRASTMGPDSGTHARTMAATKPHTLVPQPDPAPTCVPRQVWHCLPAPWQVVHWPWLLAGRAGRSSTRPLQDQPWFPGACRCINRRQ